MIRRRFPGLAAAGCAAACVAACSPRQDPVAAEAVTLPATAAADLLREPAFPTSDPAAPASAPAPLLLDPATSVPPPTPLPSL